MLKGCDPAVRPTLKADNDKNKPIVLCGVQDKIEE
jgi:hypothetical protein